MNHYLNAYVCDDATPPEIMVQLAVLLPLLDYVEWSEAQLGIMKKIKEGLPAFYSEKYGTIMRWHPKVADKMEGEEEHKKPSTDCKSLLIVRFKLYFDCAKPFRK